MKFRQQFHYLQPRGDSGMYLSVFQLPSSSFPLLEKLTLTFLDMFSPLFDAMNITSRAFLGSPNLRDLEIVDYWPKASVLELVDIPAEQLTSLNIAAPRPQYDLDSLDITCDIPPVVSPLACFMTPMLEDLTLEWRGHDYHDLYLDIVGLQNRSMTALSSLTINHFLADETFTKEMIAILSILPELTSLSIDGYKYPGSQSFDQECILLPKLTRFRLSPFEDEGYPEEMTTMILSRWWLDKDNGKHKGLTRLEKVVLPGSWVEEEVSVRISHLPGLDVEYNWEL
ncbi:hypothetical protein BT96DRAFT_924988 [Gymnopus androsaceus JB14]|uniref:F-box domain-containing protein n=1 Tax=Gymnopus androsaceus JB14 TaxID=1447944 RepID=A0A6A4H2Q5_9AGAR|nr:hypothetical protein BT96DRAFT_924988 [Gymnopus androsaceus JB14]